MFEILGSIFISVITLGMYPLVHWKTHLYMVDNYSDTNKKCSYSEFKKLFNTVDWVYDKGWKNSLFTEFDVYSLTRNSECHASIIKINNVGLKLSVYGLFMSRFLIRKKINEIKNQKKENKLVSL
jgi:hypothetical protein